MKLKAEQTVTISGLRLAYYRLGQGEPLLFLHGGRVRARTFHRVIAQLSKEYTVIAPDIPGYGDSETPKAVWSFADYADFFDAFLNQLNLDKVIVMGYSMGGGVALNLAGRSNRVAKLVLIDSAGLPPLDAKPNHHDMRRLGFYLSHPQHLSTFCTLVADFSRFAWKHRRDWQHIKTIRHHCFATPYGAALSNIKVPTRIIWGEDDWILPVETAERFKACIPQAKLHIVRGNHDWPLYDHLQLNKFMLKYNSKS